MLIQIASPAGLDIDLQSAQEQLHDALSTVWPGVNYRCYGRCYRNRTTENGYIAENYEGNSEYKEVYFDDTVDALSFFGVSQRPVDQVYNQVMIHLVFFVNLKKIKPTLLHRADEEVHQDVYNALGFRTYGLEYKGTEYWIENVLKEYPGSRRDDRLKEVDMHPNHCFRLNYSLDYDPDCQPSKNF
jgi:hypothetical protein